MSSKKKSNKNKKKKTTRQQRSQAATSCAECGKPCAVPIPCACTSVVFCSPACAQQRRVHQCSGAPPASLDLVEHMRQLKASGDTPLSSNPGAQAAFQVEYQRDIQSQLVPVMLQEGIANPASLGTSSLARLYRKHADTGNAACAYQAGVMYKNRMLGGVDSGFAFEASAQETPGVLETDELAFYYLNQAAEAGIPLAMQSLADLYEKGQGVRKSWHWTRHWLWKAVLMKSAGADHILVTKLVLRNELWSNIQMFEQVEGHLQPGQTFGPSGPNYASLLLVLYKQVVGLNCTFPAFASVEPTADVTGLVREGTTGPVQLVVKDDFKDMAVRVMVMERKHFYISPVYGRRGVAKEATAQSLSHVNRLIENQLFVIPPAPACNEVPDETAILSWVRRATRSQHSYHPQALPVHCVHSEEAARGSSRNSHPRLACMECIQQAVERMRAVATNSVALSIEEALGSRGQCAIWRTSPSDNAASSSMKSETYKDYCRAEAECLLAAIVTCRKDYDTPIAHPLFLAQDPNLYWPLILAHGTIRAALEYVAPHVDWVHELGPIVESPDPVYVTTSERYPIQPGRLLRKCGNSTCLKLEPEKTAGDFLICQGCHRRSYCSQDCQKMDFPFHKRECNAGATMPAADPRLPTNSPKKEAPMPFQQEEVVIHGLVAKPELNGKIVTIAGGLKDGRYPVQLPSAGSKVLVKSSNLLRLGILCKDIRPKKACKFTCLHGLEVCKECSLDLGLVNLLSRRHFSGETTLSQSQIEQFAETYFASIADDEQLSDGRVVSTSIDKNFPIEAQGLSSKEKQVLLKYLLESKTSSENVAVAVAALTCYGSRSELVTRPYSVRLLYSLVSLWGEE